MQEQMQEVMLVQMLDHLKQKVEQNKRKIINLPFYILDEFYNHFLVFY